MIIEKPIEWLGSSKSDLLAFPDTARKQAGYQLGKVQFGFNPTDYKPFSQIGSGVNEIRVSDEHGIFRVMYVAKFEDAVYVLHAFQKKTQKTSKHDIDIATSRYQQIKRRK